eukprot:scaffold11659_cov100-Cylindrotheca_fusiformis.AAC.2
MKSINIRTYCFAKKKKKNEFKIRVLLLRQKEANFTLVSEARLCTDSKTSQVGILSKLVKNSHEQTLGRNDERTGYRAGFDDLIRNLGMLIQSVNHRRADSEYHCHVEICRKTTLLVGTAATTYWSIYCTNELDHGTFCLELLGQSCI